ncbi:MAG: universal stress protein [Gammaproteobacteria bacterium]|nr:universal stress protein [Gammaproteobacteria bacterium]
MSRTYPEENAMKIDKVLFPTDFSTAADQAFESATFLADTHNAELILLHVVDQVSGFDQYEILALTPIEIAEKLEKHAHQKMQALVDRVKGRVTATETVREGSTWEVICDTAKEENADIIVMASQGRTGLSHALIGSVAEKVARHASCPVLIVRDQRT